MASISITSIVKHPPKNNLEPKALSKQKNKEERFRGSSHGENYKLIAPTPEERKKTISEYRFFTNGFSLHHPAKEREILNLARDSNKKN
jgi:hypothetical protein